MFAAQFDHTETVVALIKAGAEVDKKDKRGRTALILAADEGHTETVTVLTSPAKVFSSTGAAKVADSPVGEAPSRPKAYTPAASSAVAVATATSRPAGGAGTGFSYSVAKDKTTHKK